jgi:hypothetical protein
MTDTLLNTGYEQNPSNRSGDSEEHKHTYRRHIPWPVLLKRTIPTEQPPLVGEVGANF